MSAETELRGEVNDTIGAHPDLVGDYRGGDSETRVAVVDALTNAVEDAWGDRFERSDVRICVRRALRERASTDETDAPTDGTTEIEVTLPDRLVESIDATVEQSGAYADRDALVRAAIGTETAGFDGAPADDDADAGASVQCVLCDETSATVEAHEQHMDDIHADGERHR